MKLPVPRSARLARFHADLVAYHRGMAREHARRGHEDAALQHEEAAQAHELAAAPFDRRTVGAAMRAAAMADEASQKVGVRPLLPWPERYGRRALM